MAGAHGCSAPMLQPVHDGTGDSRFPKLLSPMRGCHVEPAAQRYRTAPAVLCGPDGAGDDRSARGGPAQHGLGRRMHAGLYNGARRRHHPRRAARALSAGLGAEPVLSRADGGGGVHHHPDRAACAPAQRGVSGARCDRARGVHHGRLRCRLADECLAADRDRGGHDHGLRRRRAARYPLQRRAAVVSRRTLRQRVRRDRAFLRYRLRAQPQ